MERYWSGGLKPAASDESTVDVFVDGSGISAGFFIKQGAKGLLPLSSDDAEKLAHMLLEAVEKSRQWQPQPEPLQTDVMLNEDPHIELTPTTPASVDAFLFDGLKAAALHDPATIDQAQLSIASSYAEYALERFRSEHERTVNHLHDVRDELLAENERLRKQIADQQHELEARADILNRAVKQAQMLGFEQNGWIDSLNYIADLAIDSVPLAQLMNRCRDVLKLKAGESLIGRIEALQARRDSLTEILPRIQAALEVLSRVD